MTSPRKIASRRQGFALVTVVLFASLVLGAIALTATLVINGSSQTNTQDRRALQALMFAQSGISSFPALVNKQGYRGSLASFPTWLDSQTWDVQTTSYGTYTMTASVNGSRLTITSTGTTAGSTGTKVVLKDFALQQGRPFDINVPGALTSCPQITVSGNADIAGQDGTTSGAGIIEKLTTSANASAISVTGSSTFSLPVADAKLIKTNDYLKINGTTYAVSSINYGSNTLSIAPINPIVGSTSINVNADIDLIQYATTSALPLSASDLRSVPITNPRGFTAGDTITLNGTDYVISSVDPASSILTLASNLPSLLSAAASSLVKGTTVIRRVGGAASSSSISVGGSSKVSPLDTRLTRPSDDGNGGYIYDSTVAKDKNLTSQRLLCTGSSNSNLIRQIFGTSLSDLRSTAAAAATVYTDKNDVPNTISGITYLDLRSQNGNQQIPSLCGSGIVIIDAASAGLSGNTCTNSDGSTGFNGLIYATGDLDLQGNVTVTGAIVAEGEVSTDETRVTGTGKGESKIAFDARKLLQAGALVSAKTVTGIEGSWRQR